MKANNEIFNDYDMVVSMTQEVINSELKHLQKDKKISTTLIISQMPGAGDDENDVFAVHKEEHEIPKGAAYINATIVPQVKILKSGQDITFVLKMVSGEARIWIHSKQKKFPIKNWSYGINVNMDLLNIDRKQLPELVAKQLTDFTDDMFSVNALLLNFESIKLADFNAKETHVDEGGDRLKEELAYFMKEYLGKLTGGDNPYILGYAVAQREQSKASEKGLVPDSIKPVGTKYSFFYDEKHPDKSTLNFLVVTKGSPNKISKNPPNNFPHNWIDENDEKSDISAKMIISHSNLIEEVIIKPFFEGMKKEGYKVAREAKVDTVEGNTFEQAKVNAGKEKTDHNISYTISNFDKENDKYINKMDVSFSVKENENVEITIEGYMKFYKKVVIKKSSNCKSEAWKSLEFKWDAKYTMKTENDTKGNPSLTESSLKKLTVK